jgi:hypothetical protein
MLKETLISGMLCRVSLADKHYRKRNRLSSFSFEVENERQCQLKFFFGGGVKGRGAVQITWALGAVMLDYVFVFLHGIIVSRLYKLTSSNQTQFTLQLGVFMIWCKDFYPVRPCRVCVCVWGGGVMRGTETFFIWRRARSRRP